VLRHPWWPTKCVAATPMRKIVDIFAKKLWECK
jgi:hypothetical protein